MLHVNFARAKKQHFRNNLFLWVKGGAHNPNLQNAIMHELHVCSQLHLGFH